MRIAFAGAEKDYPLLPFPTNAVWLAPGEKLWEGHQGWKFVELSDFQPSGHVQCISQRGSTQTSRCLVSIDTVVVHIVSGRTYVNCFDCP